MSPALPSAKAGNASALRLRARGLVSNDRKEIFRRGTNGSILWVHFVVQAEAAWRRLAEAEKDGLDQWLPVAAQ